MSVVLQDSPHHVDQVHLVGGAQKEGPELVVHLSHRERGEMVKCLEQSLHWGVLVDGELVLCIFQVLVLGLTVFLPLLLYLLLHLVLYLLLLLRQILEIQKEGHGGHFSRLGWGIPLPYLIVINEGHPLIDVSERVGGQSILGIWNSIQNVFLLKRSLLFVG